MLFAPHGLAASFAAVGTSVSIQLLGALPCVEVFVFRNGPCDPIIAPPNRDKAHLGLSPYHRRLLCELLEDRRLLSLGLALGGATNTTQSQTLADLPVAAQHAISSAIGQDQSAYHAASGAAGVTLANPANGFTAQVQSGALHVSSGLDTWDMSLAGLGYGGAVRPVGTAQTSTDGNRVDSDYGTIDEWYVNGPGGLEQGFTVSCGAGVSPAIADAGGTPAPQSGSLTVELALGGNLNATVNAAGDGLTLSRPDGSAALGYTGLMAYDATGKTLPASLEVGADGDHQELLIHVNTAGAQGPITIDPFVQEAKLTASDGVANGYFGTSVSVSGNTVVVGVPSARSAPTATRGRPTCYCRLRLLAGQPAKLIAADGAAATIWQLGFDQRQHGGGRNARRNGRPTPAGAAYVFTEPGPFGRL